MSLENTGEIAVEVDRATAFTFARNPQQMAACIPGLHDLRELSSERYAAVLTNKVAFLTLSFNVVVELSKVEPPNLLEATVTGDAIRLAGRMVAKASLAFADAGPNRTLIRYSAEVSITGKLGGLGQPVLKAKSVELARQFAANVKNAMENAGQSSAAEARA
jgi:carbon monoxide dehydrogenase subunit G